MKMKLKTIYLVLCVLGLVLPYWQFVPWVLANGLNMPLFFRQLFANRIGGFFAMDVLVSAVTLLVFTRREGSRLGVHGRWLPLIAVLTVVTEIGSRASVRTGRRCFGRGSLWCCNSPRSRRDLARAGR
jgi:hypothetical protein